MFGSLSFPLMPPAAAGFPINRCQGEEESVRRRALLRHHNPANPHNAAACLTLRNFQTFKWETLWKPLSQRQTLLWVATPNLVAPWPIPNRQKDTYAFKKASTI